MRELASVILFLKTHPVGHEVVELTRKMEWPVFCFLLLAFMVALTSDILDNPRVLEFYIKEDMRHEGLVKASGGV